ncbi:tetrapyrrole biosynthesis, uroporphyrinogen III synthase [Microdochium trichocladiopsis]|uniref:Tetrapyrrole biosynthesis, uroporphyrinogen III synthase n=1 Tax=Microdochium trichocladiopsis TaxID=1682393 RepID=A0A9P8Y2S1_9PEZI|nr:tetrapyrrole biosynthesis, uroporphyrinogen III synthase [Microdochium trichocladiopsis]KAH7029384.1 tetrapyrrole biosynthesis, uroporphyrinogen III synthase [Microdochium trichocladiopsis]
MTACQPKIPVLLLKTKSAPGDSYQDIFSGKQPDGHPGFEPHFVPVLQHQFLDDGMLQVGGLLQSRQIGTGKECKYGGLIFTSQRAVEAFAKLVEDGKAKDEDDWPHLSNVPVYSVGPSTTRALKAVSQHPSLQIFGEHTGNGEALALFIQEHYTSWYSGRATLPPLLFLVGEQRRDIIPKTLMNPSLAADKRIEVTETIVYGTGVMETFPADFATILSKTGGTERWVVVFSPTGCDSMLRGLGLLDDNNRVLAERKHVQPDNGPQTYIATIGPTTRDFLQTEFGYVPDVCAAKPSPEGVLSGIVEFDSRQ